MKPDEKGAPPDVRVYPNARALADAAAAEIVAQARASIAARGRFTIALSGGSTPRPIYELLGTRHASDIQWERTHVFFGDERCVSPDDARSNYAMAHEALLARVAVAPARVHRMYEANDPPQGAAERYETLLRATFGDEGPTFDVALQGVGADGHTASLIPGDPAVDEMARWVLAVRAPDTFEVRDRLTLTPVCLNRSRVVLFVATGESKRGVVARVLGSGSAPAQTLPAARLHGMDGTRWLLDASAAPASA